MPRSSVPVSTGSSRLPGPRRRFRPARAGAFWRSENVRVVDSADDAAGSLDAPLLGVLPRHRAHSAAAAARVVTARDSPEARDYEFIASTLALATRESEARVLL